MSLCIDNFQFSITAWKGYLSWDLLEACVRVAMADAAYISAYLVKPGEFERVAEPRQLPRLVKPPRLVFYRSLPAGAQRLPFKMDYVLASQFVKAWLETAEYPWEPDHDGSNSKGWKLYNCEWGMVDGEQGSVFAVEPTWVMHGK